MAFHSMAYTVNGGDPITTWSFKWAFVKPKDLLPALTVNLAPCTLEVLFTGHLDV